ncbi:uncharacterized protein LOC131061516 isoform X3 [Cryptomeria japonica]|uniref:uncharacterized protein LOC131061516 isoform X3 n=1 Tax=Cryptomeria japonica TaxID=3369 RepID=UPI0025AC66E6|nr:uncharacterized protein LOC131061516 isoform X3 [Cryptomeria japonica]
MPKKDEAWKYTEDFIGRQKNQTKCFFCKEINFGGINRFKYHIAGIPGHDIEVCKLQTLEAKRFCYVQLETHEQEKLTKKRQLVELSAIGSHAPTSASASASASASTSVGCVGEGSSMPPFRPSASASASASTSTPPSGTITFGPRVRKSRLDSYFVPRSTPGAQPSLESMGWNKEVHDAAKKQICKFWYFCNIPFIAARSPYWQGMVDSITICGAGFKAPTDAELSGPLLLQMVEDMKVELEDHRQSWSQKGCTIMTDGWTDRRNRTLLNFLVSCGGSTMFLKSIDASSHVKNATYSCEAIEEVIQEVGEENVVQVVTDNAASYVAAGKLLMERHPKSFWSPCAAHCLDLMLEDIGKLEWVKSIVERAKNISKFIYNHALVLSIMRQYTGQKELARPGITRFASNFLTLKSLIKSKAALRRMFVGEEWTSSSYATTTTGIDVVNCFFDEPGFWTPCGETMQVNSVKFNEYSTTIISAGYDRTLRAWDCRSHSTEPIQTIDTFSDSVMSVCLTKTEIIAGSVDGTIRTFDIRMGREIVDHLGQSVNCISVSNDNNCILASCLDSTIRLLDRSTGELLQEYKGHVCKMPTLLVGLRMVTFIFGIWWRLQLFHHSELMHLW